MDAETRRDILLLASQYASNKEYLIDALRKAGLPSAWLNGWDAKLKRLAKKAKAADGLEKN